MRISEPSSWPCTGKPRNPTTCLRTLNANVTLQFCHLINFRIRQKQKSPQTPKSQSPWLYFPAGCHPVHVPAMAVFCELGQGSAGAFAGCPVPFLAVLGSFFCLSLRISCCELSQFLTYLLRKERKRRKNKNSHPLFSNLLYK